MEDSTHEIEEESISTLETQQGQFWEDALHEEELDAVRSIAPQPIGIWANQTHCAEVLIHSLKPQHASEECEIHTEGLHS